jgi:hypothetical protein
MKENRVRALVAAVSFLIGSLGMWAVRTPLGINEVSVGNEAENLALRTRSLSAPTDIEKSMVAFDADLQTKTIEKLMAEVEHLRAERESLLNQQRAELEKRTPYPEEEQEEKKPTFFRHSPALLTAYAKHGTFSIRTPLLQNLEWDLGPAGEKESDLTAAELSQVTEIYRSAQKRTEERVRKIYLEIAGDVSKDKPLLPSELWGKIFLKTPPEAQADAIRILAKERAGLIPSGSGGSSPAFLAALRVQMEEENLLFDALERLLGPTRAERFVNGEHVPRFGSKFVAGP